VSDPVVDKSSSRLLKTATRASVAVSSVLVVVKFFTWLITGSVSIFASLLDSLMDIAASLINLFAVDYSLKPADEDHRFGHGKAEALAGMGQSVFIALSALFLLVHAVERFITPQPVANLPTALWVIVFAIVLTIVLVSFQRFVVRKTGSTAVQADSLHYFTDLITNVATLVALVFIANGFTRADSIFGMLIGLYILYSAARVGWAAVRILMDEELPADERATIMACVEGTPGVIAVQRLRSWRSGQRRVIDLDVVFAGERTLDDINQNSEAVVQRLIAEVPSVDVSIRPVPQRQ
jgi:ferrous-iron efflux pump FieF